MSESMKGRQAWNRGIPNPQLSARQTGRDNHMWRGGVTTLNHKIRNHPKMIIWRNTIFNRDDFTCKGCGRRGFHLNADHIKPFAQILIENNIKTLEEALLCEELWDSKNGRTLCDDCHKETPNYGRNIIYLEVKQN